MVLGCDLVVAAEAASFGLPEPRVGRLPLDGMVTLPRRLPRALAMGILLTGRRIGAAQALEYGLVNEVVPDVLAGYRRRCLGRRPRGLRAPEPEGDQALGRRHRAPDRHGSPLTPACRALAAALQSRDADDRSCPSLQGETRADLDRPLSRRAAWVSVSTGAVDGCRSKARQSAGNRTHGDVVSIGDNG